MEGEIASYPFIRLELRLYDPDGCDVLTKLWRMGFDLGVKVGLDWADIGG